MNLEMSSEHYRIAIGLMLRSFAGKAASPTKVPHQMGGSDYFPAPTAIFKYKKVGLSTS